MAGVRHLPSGKWQGWFKAWDGRRQWFTLPGTDGHRKGAVAKAAAALEVEHDKMRRGVLPSPQHPAHHLNKSFPETINEYLAWGRLQGGIAGRPWNATHAHNRRQQLAWWQDMLDVSTLGECQGCLGAVEQALQTLAEGRSGKTVAGYRESLAAFFDWCVAREYLAIDPLRHATPINREPTKHRRAMTSEEVQCLLAACPLYRALLYEVAICTGLRAGELRQLGLEHLDVQRSGLRLSDEWTKNRRAGFQPLPQALVARLAAFALAEQPQALYHRQAQRRTRPIPPRALLYVPSMPARMLHADLRRAGIPRETPEGALDFHAFRTAYINFVIAAGATVPEAQRLARHATPHMTIGVYGRAAVDRLTVLVERVAHEVHMHEVCAPAVHEQAVEAGNTVPVVAQKAASVSAPPRHTSSSTVRPVPSLNRNIANISTPNVRPAVSNAVQTPEESAGIPTTFCAPDVHADPEVQEILHAWGDLPDPIKQQVLAFIRQIQKGTEDGKS